MIESTVRWSAFRRQIVGGVFMVAALGAFVTVAVAPLL
jgi:hypothetical protein